MSAYVVVFLAMFGLDFVWSYYTRAITNHIAASAAHWSVGILVLNGVVTRGYVEDWTLFFPAVAGAWLGTYASIKWRKDGP